MYLSYYNLTSKPFKTDPDPTFIWLEEKYKEVLCGIKDSIKADKGLISLTGDVGAGKSTLVKALIKDFADSAICAKIPEPSLAEFGFFTINSNAFEINKSFRSEAEFLSHLRRFLSSAQTDNKQVLLIIEEAQRLNQELLEKLCLLINIDDPDKKLINILFVGQNEFDNMLSKKENQAFGQRIKVHYHIEPLTEAGSKEYIMHRLQVAGSKRKIFTTTAIREIFNLSEGNPRLINSICDLALLSGSVRKAETIEPEIIKECAAIVQIPKSLRKVATIDQQSLVRTRSGAGREIQKENPSDVNQDTMQKGRSKPALRKTKTVAMLALCILFGLIGYFYYIGGLNAPLAYVKAFWNQAFSPFLNTASESSPLNEHAALRQAEIATLKNQLKALEDKKAVIETRINQLKSRNEALVVDLKELQKAKELIAELKRMSVVKDQVPSPAEEKLKASPSHPRGLEAIIANREKELAEKRGKQIDSRSEDSAKEAESPDPAELIDWVLKKKSD